MENYIVVLFKNKKKKKIIKKFITIERAKLFFDKLMKESEDIVFEVLTENGCEAKYELAIIELKTRQEAPIYLVDEFGRNIKIKMDENDKNIYKILPYKKEETIYDLSQNKKIKLSQLIRRYLSGDGLKMVSVLNNKIIIQHDEKVNLFTLKSSFDADRFIDQVSLHFFKIKRGDCLFVKDSSTPQKKYLYELLESKGISKKILYRKFTSLPPSK
jgi:hypothetical protein